MSLWDGVERRKERQPIHCLHEEDWGSLKATVENLDRRINGSLIAIQKHMDDGNGWRVAIVGIILTIVLQIVSFAYLWGGLSKQVDVNTEILKEQTRDLEDIKSKTYGNIKEIEAHRIETKMK